MRLKCCVPARPTQMCSELECLDDMHTVKKWMGVRAPTSLGEHLLLLSPQHMSIADQVAQSHSREMQRIQQRRVRQCKASLDTTE